LIALFRAVIEVDKRVGGPELALQILAHHQFSTTLRQDHQYLEGLLRDFDSDTAFAQFAFLESTSKTPKHKDARVLGEQWQVRP
jgi:hypothetical protein